MKMRLPRGPIIGLTMICWSCYYVGGKDYHPGLCDWTVSALGDSTHATIRLSRRPSARLGCAVDTLEWNG